MPYIIKQVNFMEKEGYQTIQTAYGESYAKST